MATQNELAPEPAERVLLITRRFDAPRCLVFRAWTKPEFLTRWFGPRDFTLPFCEVDFRPGGAYRVCMRSPEGVDHWLWGVYREIVEPERIVFTWDREDETGQPRSNTVVTVTLTEQAGQTILNLRQVLFATVADRDEHVGGWTECLERLSQFVTPPPA